MCSKEHELVSQRYAMLFITPVREKFRFKSFPLVQFGQTHYCIFQLQHCHDSRSRGRKAIKIVIFTMRTIIIIWLSLPRTVTVIIDISTEKKWMCLSIVKIFSAEFYAFLSGLAGVVRLPKKNHFKFFTTKMSLNHFTNAHRRFWRFVNWNMFSDKRQNSSTHWNSFLSFFYIKCSRCEHSKSLWKCNSELGLVTCSISRNKLKIKISSELVL